MDFFTNRTACDYLEQVGAAPLDFCYFNPFTHKQSWTTGWRTAGYMESGYLGSVAASVLLTLEPRTPNPTVYKTTYKDTLSWTGRVLYYVRPLDPGQIVLGVCRPTELRCTVVAPAVDLSRYPHRCPACQAPAYLGAVSSVECTGKWCRFYHGDKALPLLL